MSLKKCHIVSKPPPKGVRLPEWHDTCICYISRLISDSNDCPKSEFRECAISSSRNNEEIIISSGRRSLTTTTTFYIVSSSLPITIPTVTYLLHVGRYYTFDLIVIDSNWYFKSAIISAKSSKKSSLKHFMMLNR